MTYVKLQDAVKAVEAAITCNGVGTRAIEQILADDAIKALRSLPTDDGWQPIATAPRDGTRIDIWDPDCGGIRVADAYWSGGQKSGGWHAPNQDYDGMDGLYAKDGPTHWRPLPAPPAC